MFKNGPIIIIEDDADDQELLNEIIGELQVPNIVKFFNTCLQALDYLTTTIERPFLIISDINLPIMTGLELYQKIQEKEILRKKSIPFVFLTTTSDERIITQSYQMCAQGFFVKPASVGQLKEMIKVIIGYWKVCRHPYIE